MQREGIGATTLYIAYAVVTAIAFYGMALLGGIVASETMQTFTYPTIDWFGVCAVAFGLWLSLEPMLAGRASLSSRLLVRLAVGILGLICVPRWSLAWLVEVLQPLFTSGLNPNTIRVLFILAGGYSIGQIALDLASFRRGGYGRDIFY